ncbi:hypothetical protein BDZ89DRAFT_1074758 [Hymenopellis radicata]|nr:hypothetical protein BDZ89DRAFT_1074758 [Hymenopellis radicata]
MFDDADRPTEASSSTKPAAPAPAPKSQPQSNCGSCSWSPWASSLPGQLRTLLKVEPDVKTQDK